MKKTIAFILNYNTPDLTDSLYESLRPYAGDLYDLMVLDNNSEESKRSKYPTIQTGENLYWGGGLNWAFNYVLEHDEYDSLLFLNSDLTLKGKNFVKKLREHLFDGDFMIVSPSMIEEFKRHTPKSVTYNQMANWNTNSCRTVDWIDFQCPLIHRNFIEHIKQFDDDLKLGYGICFICAFACEDMKWKIGVHDELLVNHLGQESWKRKSLAKKYEHTANQELYDHLSKIGAELRYKNYIKYAKNYCVSKNLGQVIFDDIKNINGFRYDPFKYGFDGEWRKARYWKWRSTSHYIQYPTSAINSFKTNIISDGSRFGYYIRINEQVNNNHIFCGTKVFLKAFEDGAFEQFKCKSSKLFIAGDDHLLSGYLKELHELSQNFQQIYYEAKDVKCEFVKAFPMGSTMTYLLSNILGGDVAPKGLKKLPQNNILDTINLDYTNFKKNKLIASSFSYRYKHLTEQIEQRQALVDFIETVDYIDTFEVDPKDYYQKLSEYKFFICPIGQGIQTPKLQECLLVNTIPVVLNHCVYGDLQEWGLPLLVVNSWSEITKELLENYYNNEYQKINWTDVRKLFHSDYFEEVFLKNETIHNNRT
jgi:hypothetical protein